MLNFCDSSFRLGILTNTTAYNAEFYIENHSTRAMYYFYNKKFTEVEDIVSLRNSGYSRVSSFDNKLCFNY